jgi:hypothetical protein
MRTNTRTNEPARPEEPKGDLGHGHKTWTPDSGEQGISNRPADEGDAVTDGDPEDDDAALNGDDDEDIEEESEGDATKADR